MQAHTSDVRRLSAVNGSHAAHHNLTGLQPVTLVNTSSMTLNSPSQQKQTESQRKVAGCVQNVNVMRQ